MAGKKINLFKNLKEEDRRRKAKPPLGKLPKGYKLGSGKKVPATKTKPPIGKMPKGYKLGSGKKLPATKTKPLSKKKKSSRKTY